MRPRCRRLSGTAAEAAASFGELWWHHLTPLLCRHAEQQRTVDATLTTADGRASSALFVDRTTEALLRGFAPSAPLPSPPQALVDLVAVRTRAVDAWLETPTWPPVRTTERQVVLLNAGLDSRAYRLGLGRRTTIFEVEAAHDGGKELLELKRAVLDDAGHNRRTRTVDVLTDVGDPDRCAAALLDAGLDPSVPTRWVLEGPLVPLGASTSRSFAAVGELFAMASERAGSPASGLASQVPVVIA